MGELWSIWPWKCFFLHHVAAPASIFEDQEEELGAPGLTTAALWAPLCRDGLLMFPRSDHQTHHFCPFTLSGLFSSAIVPPWLRMDYMLGTMPRTVWMVFYLILPGLCEGADLTNSILYLRRPVNREIKCISQGHWAKNWHGQGSDSGLFNAKPYMLNLKISSSQSVAHGPLGFPRSFIGSKPCLWCYLPFSLCWHLYWWLRNQWWVKQQAPQPKPRRRHQTVLMDIVFFTGTSLHPGEKAILLKNVLTKQ